MRSLFFMLVLVFGALSVKGAETGEACKILRITGAANYTPVSYAERDQLTGIGPELAAELAQELNQPYTMNFSASWARTVRRFVEGELDLVAGLYKTAEREKQMVFLGPFMQEKTWLVMRRDNPIDYETWDDLRGYRGVVVKEDSRGDGFDSFSQQYLDILEVPSQALAFKMLEASRVDFLVVGQNTPLRDAIGTSERVEVHAKPIDTQDVYMALSKNSPCAPLAEVIQQHLDKALIAGRATAIADQLIAQP